MGVAFNDMAGMLVPDFIKNNGVTFPVGFSPREQVMSYLGLSPDARARCLRLCSSTKKE